MQKNNSAITVFFDDPFWVGVYERNEGKRLAVCKITFGAEPKDYEVYEYLLEHWDKLVFSKPINAEVKPEAKIKSKRLQREIKKRIARPGVGTKAQQAIQLQQAEGKAARKKKTKLARDQEKERQFAIKQNKRKQKHKGR